MTHAAAPIPHAGDVITGKVRRHGRTHLTWVAVVAALALAVGLALVVLAGSTGTQPVVPTAPQFDQGQRHLAELEKLVPALPDVPAAPEFDQGLRHLAELEKRF